MMMDWKWTGTGKRPNSGEVVLAHWDDLDDDRIPVRVSEYVVTLSGRGLWRDPVHKHEFCEPAYWARIRLPDKSTRPS